MNQNKMNSFEGLSNMKKNLQDNEPLVKERKVTTKMLTGSTSKKILKYYFSMPEIAQKIEKYAETKGKTSTLEEIKNTLEANENLNEKDLIFIDSLYKKMIQAIPISEGGNEKIYGRVADAAGCTKEERAEAILLLSDYNEPILQRVFKETRKLPEELE